MLYLSQISFQSNPETYRFLGESNFTYKAHQLVSLAQSENAKDGRILWRLESAKNKLPKLLVQTDFAPDFGRLTGSEFSSFVEKPQVKKFKLNTTTGQLYGFKARVNPTMREFVKNLPKGKRGPRVPIVENSELATWILRKEESCGFKLVHSQIDAEDPLIFKKPKGQSVTLNSICLSGKLIVTNATLFHETMRNGLGSAKGFGFGMISLKRIVVDGEA